MIPEKITTIEQQAFLRGYQKLEICQDGNVEITIKRFSSHRQFKIPFLRIVPNSARMRFYPVGTSVSVTIFGLLTLWMLIQVAFSKDWNTANLFFIPLIFFAIMLTVCLCIFRVRSVNATVFYLRQGGQLHVWLKKPNATIFQSFCETLSKKAEEAWQNRPPEISPQSLAGELAALKKLKDDGVLSEAEFEKTKAKLIGPTEERKIGFQQ
jgi:hypothetical protein